MSEDKICDLAGQLARTLQPCSSRERNAIVSSIREDIKARAKLQLEIISIAIGAVPIEQNLASDKARRDAQRIVRSV